MYIYIYIYIYINIYKRYIYKGDPDIFTALNLVSEHYQIDYNLF